ncbi:hypothetical protein HT031_004133 [Scenedesmus sp. PABB004]|nr:hypothetical protein HT031_004133 [Scenedesmus sp. PABB004]
MEPHTKTAAAAAKIAAAATAVAAPAAAAPADQPRLQAGLCGELLDSLAPPTGPPAAASSELATASSELAAAWAGAGPALRRVYAFESEAVVAGVIAFWADVAARLRGEWRAPAAAAAGLGTSGELDFARWLWRFGAPALAAVVAEMHAFAALTGVSPLRGAACGQSLQRLLLFLQLAGPAPSGAAAPPAVAQLLQLGGWPCGGGAAPGLAAALRASESFAAAAYLTQAAAVLPEAAPPPGGAADWAAFAAGAGAWLAAGFGWAAPQGAQPAAGGASACGGRPPDTAYDACMLQLALAALDGPAGPAAPRLSLHEWQAWSSSDGFAALAALLCTYDRPELLARGLVALAQQQQQLLQGLGHGSEPAPAAAEASKAAAAAADRALLGRLLALLERAFLWRAGRQPPSQAAAAWDAAAAADARALLRGCAELLRPAANCGVEWRCGALALMAAAAERFAQQAPGEQLQLWCAASLEGVLFCLSHDPSVKARRAAVRLLQHVALPAGSREAGRVVRALGAKARDRDAGGVAAAALELLVQLPPATLCAELAGADWHGVVAAGLEALSDARAGGALSATGRRQFAALLRAVLLAAPAGCAGGGGGGDGGAGGAVTEAAAIITALLREPCMQTLCEAAASGLAVDAPGAGGALGPCAPPGGKGLRSFHTQRGRGALAELGEAKLRRVAAKSGWKNGVAELAHALEEADELFVDLEGESLAYVCAGMALPDDAVLAESAPADPAAARAARVAARRARRAGPAEPSAQQHVHGHGHSHDSLVPAGALELAPQAALGSATGSLPDVSEPDADVPLTLDAVLSLHSRPSAAKKIYLSFNGSTVTNTDWNTGYNVPTIVTPPYSADNDTTSFTAGELANIVAIWRSVAEDFAVFDVDVTTSPAGLVAGNGVRVAVGGSSTTWAGGSYGGMAYISSFNRPASATNTAEPSTCFVWPDQLSKGNVRYVWEAISHEVGHTLGLHHDGLSNACVNSTLTGTTAYYKGDIYHDSNWSPIMGSGYYSSIATWDQGVYPCAYNPAGLQNDLEVMQATGSLTRLGQLLGTSLAAAAPLALTANASAGAGASDASATGLVPAGGAVEHVRFNVPSAGLISLAATGIEPPRVGGVTRVRTNLDLLLRLYDASGSLLATFGAAPALGTKLVVTGDNLAAAGNFTAPAAGTYYATVTGTAWGTPTTRGFSNYSSVGYFKLRVLHVASGTPAASPSPSPAPVPSPSPSPAPATVPSPSPSPSPATVPSPSPSPSPAPVPSPSPSPEPLPVPSPSPSPMPPPAPVALVLRMTVTSAASPSNKNQRVCTSVVTALRKDTLVPVPGVALAGAWSNGALVSDVTAADGTDTASTAVQTRVGSCTYTVNSATLAGYQLDVAASKMSGSTTF